MYGEQTNGDEYVRAPMLWGDSYTTAYTDKIDKNAASNIATVDKQLEDKNSLLNTYLTFTRLRNTYPILLHNKCKVHLEQSVRLRLLIYIYRQNGPVLMRYDIHHGWLT